MLIFLSFCNKGKKAGKLYVIWLPKEKYGKAELMELKRVPTAACKKIIKAYLAKEDSTPYRVKYFGAEEKKESTEIEPIEEALPVSLKDVENKIIKLETDLKTLDAMQKEMKAGLMALMVEHNVKKWSSERLTITRKLDGTRGEFRYGKAKERVPRYICGVRKSIAN